MVDIKDRSWLLANYMTYFHDPEFQKTQGARRQLYKATKEYSPEELASHLNANQIKQMISAFGATEGLEQSLKLALGENKKPEPHCSPSNLLGGYVSNKVAQKTFLDAYGSFNREDVLAAADTFRSKLGLLSGSDDKMLETSIGRELFKKTKLGKAIDEAIRSATGPAAQAS